MSENPRDSSDKLVGVDTNILINFGNFRRLAWETLFPDATSITVLVSAKVLVIMPDKQAEILGDALRGSR
ncbi:hypothetical protein ACCS70_27095 [Rhizobium ruizarguesonis]